MNKKSIYVAALALLLLGLGQPSLFAQGAPVAASNEVSAAAASAALDYWTPERMASAIPRDLGAGDVTQSGGAAQSSETSGPEVSVPGALPGSSDTSTATGAAASAGAGSGGYAADPQTHEAEYPYPFTRFNVFRELYAANAIPPVYPYTTVGKLFFSIGMRDFVCSASVLRPHLVITARHCIFDYVDPMGGVFATNVVFFPDWFHGANGFLHNGWPARILHTWVSNAPNFKFDIGFIQTFDDTGTGCGGSSGGNPIENYTGFLGFIFGGDVRTRHYNMFGYPAAAPFDGTIMVEAQGDRGGENLFGAGFSAGTFSVGNDMTGGSSGGPWMVNFFPDQAGALNQVNGLNSFKFTVPARPLEMNSPRFEGDNFNNLLTGAVGLPCP